MNLLELILHIQENRLLRDVEGLKAHFWDMVVVDILINNTDRNNGNRGLVFNGEVYKIAPVYDNGNAFSNKTTDEKIRRLLSDQKTLETSVLGSSMTIYDYKGHMLNGAKMLQLDYGCLREAIKRNVPLIGERMNDIAHMIDEISESFNDIQICSPERKEYYKAGLRIRYEKLLLPAYQRLAT